MIIPDLIYDVGMHIGNDAEFYLKKGFRVVGVEANSGHCSLVEQRLAQYVDSGQLTIVNVAIAPREGEATFYLNEKESEWGTINPRWVERNARLGAASHPITVPAARFADVLRAHGVPYYLKIDIEGADLLCVEDLASCSIRPKFLSLETATSFDRLFDELTLLWGLGYRRYKVVAQQWVRRQRCPFPPREGAFVAHRFGRASSGLFGEELPGEWLDIEAILNRYRRIFRWYRHFGERSTLRRLVPLQALDWLAGWHDLHAMHGGNAD